MNTLPRAVTARFFSTPDAYTALQRHWGNLMNSERKHELTAAHHLLYLVLRGKDWRKAFTPVTNRRKLENGGFSSWGLFRALSVLHFPMVEQELLAPFDGLVTPEVLRVVRSLVPRLTAHSFSPEDISGGAFPADAYVVPEEILSHTPGQDRANA